MQRKVNVVEDLDGTDILQDLHCRYIRKVGKWKDIMCSK